MPGKQLDDQGENHSEGDKQVLFIRHGESDAHVGKAATHIEVVGLTTSGKAQALEIAEGIPRAPDLIVVSPYLRAWETADPTMKRFPGVPHAIWQEVREFTYLGSLAGKFMTKEERSVYVDAYWESCQPLEKDGNAESFAGFIGRVQKALEKLREELEEKHFIVVFTHEQFIRAAQCLLLKWKKGAEENPQCMKDFRAMLLDYPLPYGYRDDESWLRHSLQHVLEPQTDILLADIPQAALLTDESLTYVSRILR